MVDLQTTISYTYSGDKMEIKYYVELTDSGMTVLSILKNKLNISKNLIRVIKSKNLLTINNITSMLSSYTQYGDIIKIKLDFDDKSKSSIIPEKNPLNIIYEDEYLIAINKSPGIIVHPTTNQQTGTLVNMLIEHYIQSESYKKARPLYRLDKNTTGIILFAKNQYIHNFINKQSKNNAFKKEYIGIVHGIYDKDAGVINEPISRANNSIILRKVSENGKKSITHFEVIKRTKQFSVIKFILETGRTHQIRVHTSYIGHPLVGDDLYNPNNCDVLNRHALHCYAIQFIHPTANKVLKLECPIPYDMEKVIFDDTF